MPRNVSELKSGGGGTIPMLSPRPEKWGGGTRPPRPPPIDARVCHHAVYMKFDMVVRYSCLFLLLRVIPTVRIFAVYGLMIL